MAKEYIIYCDESISKGRFYSKFYGGALVKSHDLEPVVNKLKRKKEELCLFGEIKWTKVTENYLEKYKSIMTDFFDMIREDRIKVRIMFSQNAQVPVNLSKENIDNSFHVLYYQFVKHAFGLKYHDDIPLENTYLRLYFDRLPLNAIKNELFKNHIYGLQGQHGFQKALLKIRMDDIVEIESHDHVILQCMDIVLGAIAFRLNDHHKDKPEGERRRGKKTIAKEKLYKHILHLIRGVGSHPNFNIGISTGRSDFRDTWNHPYRHWKFTPSEFTEDKTKYK